MNYKVGQKVKIQSEDWYNANKQANGFIILKDGNKISTFSPGMVKFCDQVFTVAKVVPSTSIYPDHYTFVEDGGAYKWSDQMIAGPADGTAETYTRPEQPAAPAHQPNPVEQSKPVEQPKSVEQPKPTEQPKSVEQPKPTEQPKSVEQPKPAEQPKPTEQPKPAEQPKPKAELKPKKETKSVSTPKCVDVKKEDSTEEKTGTQPDLSEQPKPEVQKPVEVVNPSPVRPEPAPAQEDTEIDAFESYKLLLKPRANAPLTDCAVQAFKIISANDMFPEVSFDFNGFEFSITRK